jgi:hypothetical protein
MAIEGNVLSMGLSEPRNGDLRAFVKLKTIRQIVTVSSTLRENRPLASCSTRSRCVSSSPGDTSPCFPAAQGGYAKERPGGPRPPSTFVPMFDVLKHTPFWSSPGGAELIMRLQYNFRLEFRESGTWTVSTWCGQGLLCPPFFPSIPIIPCLTGSPVTSTCVVAIDFYELNGIFPGRLYSTCFSFQVGKSGLPSSTGRNAARLFLSALKYMQEPRKCNVA